MFTLYAYWYKFAKAHNMKLKKNKKVNELNELINKDGKFVVLELYTCINNLQSTLTINFNLTTSTINFNMTTYISITKVGCLHCKTLFCRSYRKPRMASQTNLRCHWNRSKKSTLPAPIWNTRPITMPIKKLTLGIITTIQTIVINQATATIKVTSDEFLYRLLRENYKICRIHICFLFCHLSS